MNYVSTRGGVDPADFVDACLTGLAPDGGLFTPEGWPAIAPAAPDEPYPALAARVLSAFAGMSVSGADIAAMCEAAYASFAHHAVTPLVQTGPNHWLLELHHGPTLAFKDVAMQFIAQLYDHALSARGRKMTVLCATSGDTGGAAAAAFAGAENVDLVILHPDERISPVQRLFMTTTGADNVTNLAVDGDFDDCQAIVKGLFADRDFVAEAGLSGVNSINWARIAAQAVYYAAAQAALGPGRPVRFIVPSGNMGDALAGYVAGRCGLLGGGFETVCAVNRNRTLADLLGAGEMKQAPAVATPSPAMDISLPSNFERLMFEAARRDPSEIRAFYGAYAQSGEARLPETIRGPLGCMGLTACAVSDEETLAEIARTEAETGWLVCPHTAVGLAAARRLPDSDAATVVLATAHAAKFPETVEQAIGRRPGLPDRCGALLERGESFECVAADEAAVRAVIHARLDR
ncbi:MAG: threonine synthase [Pseudomonadota bacterium]